MELKLGKELQLQGDLESESDRQWPEDWAEYVKKMQYELHQNDFLVKLFSDGDSHALMLVGESHRSRFVAVHKDDPRGVLYILIDDGSDLQDSSTLNFERALTYGHLARDPYLSVVEELGLREDAHQNTRLEGYGMSAEMFAS